MRTFLKENKIFFIFIGIAVLMPVILHVGYNYIQIIPTIDDLPSSVWLLFFGSYFGGLATLAAVFFSTKSSNDANRKLIERQWNERKFEEYKQILLSNIDVMSIPELKFNLSNMSLDESSLATKRNAIAQKKKDSYKCDIAFRIASRIETESKRDLINEESEYYIHWRFIVSKISDILDAQLDIIQLGTENIQNNQQLKILYELRSTITRNLAIEINEELKNQLQNQLEDTNKDISESEEKHKNFIPNMEEKFKIYENKYEEFPNYVRQLYDLTINLLDFKEQEINTNK